MTLIFYLPTPKNFFSFITVLIILSTIPIMSLATAQDTTQDIELWHIKVANYLNNTEATNELNRLAALGFNGSLTTISDNGTDFSQLRIGCFLNETTAQSHFNSLSTHLRYPSLSSLSSLSSLASNTESDTVPATSLCLGYEVGILLPDQWKIIRNDDIFLVAVTLLDYERLVGFNTLSWQSFQSEELIPQDWLELKPVSTSANLSCQGNTSEAISCNFGETTFSTELNGEILWQKGNTVIYKVGSRLNVIRVEVF